MISVVFLISCCDLAELLVHGVIHASGPVGPFGIEVSGFLQSSRQFAFVSPALATCRTQVQTLFFRDPLSLVFSPLTLPACEHIFTLLLCSVVQVLDYFYGQGIAPDHVVFRCCVTGDRTRTAHEYVISTKRLPHPGSRTACNGTRPTRGCWVRCASISDSLGLFISKTEFVFILCYLPARIFLHHSASLHVRCVCTWATLVVKTVGCYHSTSPERVQSSSTTTRNSGWVMVESR